MLPQKLLLHPHPQPKGETMSRLVSPAAPRRNRARNSLAPSKPILWAIAHTTEDIGMKSEPPQIVIMPSDPTLQHLTAKEEPDTAGNIKVESLLAGGNDDAALERGASGTRASPSAAAVAAVAQPATTVVVDAAQGADDASVVPEVAMIEDPAYDPLAASDTEMDGFLQKEATVKGTPQTSV